MEDLVEMEVDVTIGLNERLGRFIVDRNTDRLGLLFDFYENSNKTVNFIIRGNFLYILLYFCVAAPCVK